MPKIGSRYGDGFQLIRELARGTRARVFLGSDGSAVEAVKVHPRGRDERADRELQAGRALDHPNLVTVRRRLDLSGAPAVTMPFVPGPRLSDWSRTADLAARLDVLDALLDGLQAFHASGFVHRDVKPENVLLSGRGPVLVDYDLAAPLDARSDVRATAGTPAYLSPEQARGEPAGPASDLYAVGVLLYRWLTGELPFAGPPDEVIAAHRDQVVAPPSRHAASARPYDAIVLRLLDKRPEARFGDAASLRRALREVRARPGN